MNISVISYQVYVSCGEQWLDPQVTMAQHKKRLQLSNLASDITTVSAYCVMRNPKSEHTPISAVFVNVQ